MTPEYTTHKANAPAGAEVIGAASIPWEETLMKDMVYFTLFGSGDCGEGEAARPRQDRPMGRKELVGCYLCQGQRSFESKHKDSGILGTAWFMEFLKFARPVPMIREYLMEKDKAPNSRGAFLDCLMERMWEFTVYDTRQPLAGEEKVLRDYLNLLVSMVKNIIRDTGIAGAKAEDPQQKRAGCARYLEALTDRDRYLSLLDEFLKLGGRKDWSRFDLHEYPDWVWKNRYDLCLMRDEYIHAPGDGTVLAWREELAGEVWEDDSAYFLTRHMDRMREREKRRGRSTGDRADGLSEAAKAYLAAYCGRAFGEEPFDVKPLTSKEDGPNRHGLKAYVLIDLAGRGFTPEAGVTPASPAAAAGMLSLCKYPPEEGADWLPAKYLPAPVLSRQITAHLKAGIANDEVLSWHIRYCMDHPVPESIRAIGKIAKNQMRKKRVRELAMECMCMQMDVDAACRDVLPRLQGDLFFFVAEQFKSTGDRRVADLVWHYGETYAIHKLRCDVTLLYLQDRRGVDSLLNHMEKRRRIPPECAPFRVSEGIRAIRCPELLPELGRFLRLGLRDSFRDGPDRRLLHAAADALVHMGRAYPWERAEVLTIFSDCLDRYGDVPWKRDFLTGCIGLLAQPV